MGSIKMTPQNDENSLKLLTACGFYAFQVRKICLWKSGGEFLTSERNLEVKIDSFSASFFCYTSAVKRTFAKMSQNSTRPHIENCAFRLGRIAKLEKCKKWSSKITFNKKQPKRANTKKQASVNQRKTAFDCNFTAKTEVRFEGIVRPRGPWGAKKRKKRFAAICENVLPMEHGKQNHDKTSLETLEGSSTKIA